MPPAIAFVIESAARFRYDGAMNRRHALVLCLAGMLAFPAAAEVYKWTDSTGKVHYSDKPPAEAKKQEVRIEAQSFGGPPRTEGWARDVLRTRAAGAEKPAAGSAGLTMYATSWCGYCRRARAYLAEKGIAYREVDIEASEANRREFKAYGGSGVPLFVSGEARLRGFNASSMDQFLARTGRR